MKSTSNKVTIRFISDDQTGSKGFDFKYTRKVVREFQSFLNLLVFIVNSL